MQNRTADEMADIVVDSMIKYFGKRVSDFAIFNIDEDESHRAFSINFQAYNYYMLLFSYEKGIFGCSIQVGEHSYISLENSQKWWEEADFDIFLNELRQEIELRIPDKFLAAKGWK